MAFFLQVASAVIIGAMAAGSLLNLSRHPHWFVRGWEFPRLQIVALTAVMAAVYYTVAVFNNTLPSWVFWTTAVMTAGTIAWHLCWIGCFTIVYPRSVQDTPEDEIQDRGHIRLVISNVEMQNREYERWLEVIGGVEADLVLAVEVDDDWVKATRPLQERFEHQVIHSQDNCYGMMLLSKLPLEDPEVRFVVQDDVPSIHAKVALANGKRVALRCLHPRPPEPVRDVDSDHRDAELVVIGREIAESDLPAIICGDLNDVAWSRTSRLFLKVSRLLDPRVGRGLYNSWHARHRFVRVPLDHIFHAPCFTLRSLKRLPYVGSDHFPILVDLQYTPELRHEQPPEPKEKSDAEEAQEIVDYEAEQLEREIRSDQQEPPTG